MAPTCHHKYLNHATPRSSIVIRMTVSESSQPFFGGGPVDWPSLTDSHDYLPQFLISSVPRSDHNDLGEHEDVHFSQDLPMAPMMNDILVQHPQPIKPKPLMVSMEQIMNNDCGHPPPHFQPPRTPNDQYTPVWTRGSGSEREGRCALCQPPVWLRLKQSAYWYHMNYVHGICAATGRPYPEPLKYRLSLGRNSDMVKCEGWCGECRAWKGVGSRPSEEVVALLDCVDDDYVHLTTVDLTKEDYKLCFPHTNWYKHCQKQHKQQLIF